MELKILFLLIFCGVLTTEGKLSSASATSYSGARNTDLSHTSSGSESSSSSASSETARSSSGTTTTTTTEATTISTSPTTTTSSPDPASIHLKGDLKSSDAGIPAVSNKLQASRRVSTTTRASHSKEVLVTESSETTEASTETETESNSSNIWPIIIGAVLGGLFLIGGVLGFLWWFRRYKKKQVEKKKAEELKRIEDAKQKEILEEKQREKKYRPHDKFPDLLPDTVWQKKGPIHIQKTLKGPVKHKLDDVKSNSLKEGDVKIDFDMMEEYDFGKNIEILTGTEGTVTEGNLSIAPSRKGAVHSAEKDKKEENVEKTQSSHSILKKKSKEDSKQQKTNKKEK